VGPVPNRAHWKSKLRKGFVLAVGLASCEPSLVVGDLVCPPSSGGVQGIDADGVFKGCGGPSTAGNGGTSAGMSAAGGNGGEMTGGASGGEDGLEVCPAGGATGNDGPLAAPWQTSFDAGFCNYEDGGFCYADPNSAYRVVTSPVHSGKFAAAFDMRPSSSGGQRQTRCFREGVLPVEAYYGAWYYVPSDLGGSHDWNLFHFAGGKAGTLLRGLWDVSMNDDAGNGFSLFIYDAVKDGHYGQVDPKPIPRDRWFQLEFYLKRAADATGEVALYQDGEELVRRVGIVTDETPSGEWYVGNYTATLENTPSTVTVYVDDVTVRLP
jgi:polysaccharide lyase-like protein